MPYTPQNPHISVALIITQFGQFADPLDWVARCLGLNAKVDRTELMENLARPGGTAAYAATEAWGSDRRTRFGIQLFGRCQGELVALCNLSFNPATQSLRTIEEAAIAMVVLNGKRVLGVQATAGRKFDSTEGLAHAEPLVRLMPLNVFNRAYFQSKLDLLEGNRKIIVADAGEAVVLRLAKPWLFYDAPVPRRTKLKTPPLLPF